MMRNNKNTGETKCTWQRKESSHLWWVLRAFPDTLGNSGARSLEPLQRGSEQQHQHPHAFDFVQNVQIATLVCHKACLRYLACRSSMLEPSLGNVLDTYQIQEASPSGSQQGREVNTGHWEWVHTVTWYVSDPDWLGQVGHIKKKYRSWGRALGCSRLV